MSAQFFFDVNTRQSLVRITMSGFFDGGDIARFIAAQNDAYRQLQCPANQHVTLVDIRDMQIQSQDSVLEFQKRLADPQVAARRIAFVVSRSLARMQIQRAAAGRPAALFTSEEEAIAWLEAAESCPVDTQAAVVGHT